MSILLAFLPTLLVTAALTLFERGHSGAPADWRRNLQVWAVYVVVMLVLLPLVHGWAGPAMLDGAHMPFWVAFPLFLLVMDFGEFAYHRAQHRVPFLWAMHSLHHSDPNMAALTTMRHFWGDQIVKKVTIWSAALMIVRPTPALYAAYGIVSLWNMVAHGDIRLSFGRWSWLLNAPAYHRRHHSILPQHYDTNFAALFPIFDVLFGSYRRPDGYPPTGMTRKPESLRDVLIWPLIWNKPVVAEETVTAQRLGHS